MAIRRNDENPTWHEINLCQAPTAIWQLATCEQCAPGKAQAGDCVLQVAGILDITSILQVTGILDVTSILEVTARREIIRHPHGLDPIGRPIQRELTPVAGKPATQ